jgi:hypothetical protein
MSPSVVLAAALAVAGASLPVFAQTEAASHACVRKDGPAAVTGDESQDALFDAAAEKLDEAVWARANSAGVKLDAGACRLVAADGHALTRREVEKLKVSPPPANDPKSKEKDAKSLDGAREAAAGAGKGGAAGTYEESKQRFDGAAPARGGDGAPFPEQGGGAALPPEARLSSALNADLQKKFAEEDVGRGLLAHFTSADGAVRLPGVALADLGGGALAVYDRPSGVINLDKYEAAKAAVSSAPEAERAALSRRLADPAKLAAYLVDHPEARAALLDQQAGTFFHETFHAWQQRRDPKVDAVEGKDPVEWEREAFREELHYFHERVMRDPSLADRSRDAEMYKRLLGGYPEFKQYTTELYQNSVGSSDFPTVEQALAKRAKAGRPGAAGGLAALRQVDADYGKREADFAANVLPAMQAEAYPLLIDRRLAAGRPAEALALAWAAPEAVRRESGPKAFAAVEDLLRSDPPPALAIRLDAWDADLAYRTKTTGSNALPPEIYAAYERDRRAAIDQRLAEAARARGRQARRDAIDWAKFYAEGLPDNAALLKRIEAAAQTVSK